MGLLRKNNCTGETRFAKNRVLVGSSYQLMMMPASNLLETRADVDGYISDDIPVQRMPTIMSLKIGRVARQVTGRVADVDGYISDDIAVQRMPTNNEFENRARRWASGGQGNG